MSKMKDKYIEVARLEYECPICNTILKVLLFMGVQPDGYVCPKCKVYFAPNDKGEPEKQPLARML